MSIVVNPAPAAPADDEEPVQQEHEDPAQQKPAQTDNDASMETSPDDKPRPGKPDEQGDGGKPDKQGDRKND